jgi:hypothetical protein
VTHDRLVLLEASILNGEPIHAVSYLEPEPEADWDSGYAFFASPPDAVGDTTVMCIHCLIDEWPDIGQGLDLARVHGEAIRSGDVWTLALWLRAANSPEICMASVRESVGKRVRPERSPREVNS